MKQPTILHVWQHGGTLSEETKRRNSLARTTWLINYSTGHWIERRLDDNILTRTADKVIPGETKAFPFIKDILRYAAFGCSDSQIICFTNADTCFSSTLTDKLLAVFAKGNKACHAHRRDFPRLTHPLSDDEIKTGKHYPGSDLFAFTAGWWRLHVGEYPDLIMGLEVFDKILRSMILKYGGVELKDAIYHERHESLWEKNRLQWPGNIYCRKLARTWLRKNGLPLEELDFSE